MFLLVLFCFLDGESNYGETIKKRANLYDLHVLLNLSIYLKISWAN